MNTITERLIKDLENLRDLLLMPWQKLDAIRTFIQLCLTYALPACPVTRLSLQNYRRKLVDVLRSICNLPKRSTVAYFFADKSVGGLGLQDPFDERHVQKVVQTIKILSSNDPCIHNIAHGQLKSVVYRCLHGEPTEQEIDKFLPGYNEGDLQIIVVQITVKHYGPAVESRLTTQHLQMPNLSPCSQCLEKHANKLKSLHDQGKVPSTNSWCYDGTGIRFCNWRFIHRARTNTFPLMTLRLGSLIIIH
jgi:hypothetical protein